MACSCSQFVSITKTVFKYLYTFLKKIMTKMNKVSLLFLQLLQLLQLLQSFSVSRTKALIKTLI